MWSLSRYLWGGGGQIGHKFQRNSSFDRLSLSRGKENRTETLNLINSQTIFLLVKVMRKRELIFRQVTVSKLS